MTEREALSQQFRREICDDYGVSMRVLELIHKEMHSCLVEALIKCWRELITGRGLLFPSIQ